MYHEGYICVISQKYFTNIISYHDSIDALAFSLPFRGDIIYKIYDKRDDYIIYCDSEGRKFKILIMI
jgi:hypothetical protein